MRVKALKSFAGKISMFEGEVREIKSSAELNNLLVAGYVLDLTPAQKAVEKPVEKPVEQPKASPKKSTKKKKK